MRQDMDEISRIVALFNPFENFFCVSQLILIIIALAIEF
jgi:hypothetical protein